MVRHVLSARQPGMELVHGMMEVLKDELVHGMMEVLKDDERRAEYDSERTSGSEWRWPRRWVIQPWKKK